MLSRRGGWADLKRMPGNILERLAALEGRMAQVERSQYLPVGVETLPGVVEASFEVTAIADNVATDIFRIQTEDETGSLDGGGYSCFVQAVVMHGGTPGASNSAVKSYTAHFGRVLKNDGTGETTAVSEISETASAATSGATRDVSTVTMTVVENSEYEVDVQLQVDLTGSSLATANVRVYVRLVWYGFLTAPQVVAATA